jgi:hypothetical protein
MRNCKEGNALADANGITASTEKEGREEREDEKKTRMKSICEY